MEWDTGDTDSVQSVDVFKHPGQPERETKVELITPQSNSGVRLHEFVSKTVWSMCMINGLLILSLLVFVEFKISIQSGLKSFTGDQTRVLCSLWKEDQVWKDLLKVPGLSSRVPS